MLDGKQKNNWLIVLIFLYYICIKADEKNKYIQPKWSGLIKAFERLVDGMYRSIS